MPPTSQQLLTSLGTAFEQLRLAARMAGCVNTSDWHLEEPENRKGMRYLVMPNDVDTSRDTRSALGRDRAGTLLAIRAMESALRATPGYRAERHRIDQDRAEQAALEESAVDHDDGRTLSQRRRALGVERSRPTPGRTRPGTRADRADYPVKRAALIEEYHAANRAAQEATS